MSLWSLFFCLPVSLAVLFNPRRESMGGDSSSSFHSSSEVLEGQVSTSKGVPCSLRSPLLRESGSGYELEEGEYSEASLVEAGAAWADDPSPVRKMSVHDSMGSEDYLVTSGTERGWRYLSLVDADFIVGASKVAQCLILCGICILGALEGANSRLREEQVCFADVMGRMVDASCLEPEDLKRLGQPQTLRHLKAEPTPACFRVAEETLRCCTLDAGDTVSESFDWDALSTEEKEEVDGEVRGEALDREGWCYGHEKYGHYLIEKSDPMLS